MLLGPVTFQDMRPNQPAAAPKAEEPAPAPAGASPTGLQVFGGRTFVDRNLIDSKLYRPWVHHEAENLFMAVHDMSGECWGNTGQTLPRHIARDLNTIGKVQADLTGQ